ncbi:MAG: hypothetical protein O2829_09950 [Bacteroidetes bacterium]|nr:hypothetical protein [Bacteroidota bacterium]MDA1269392.1 hypothetical protein [Bacteroidota bacterium]
MRRIYTIFLFLGFFCGCLSFSSAQTSSKGGVQDQVFIIQKDRVIRLPKQIRGFEKMPTLPQPKALGSLTFPVMPFFLSIPASEIQAEPATKEWEVPKLDLLPGWVRLGYGNFLSPLIEGRYMSTLSKDLQYATKFYHQSFGKGPVSWMSEESKESHTELAGYVSYFLDEAELYSSLNLKRDAYTYYGQDLGFEIPPNVDAGPIFDPNKQILGNLKLGIRDLDKVGRIGYEVEVILGGFRDSFAAREEELGGQGRVTFRPSKDASASLALTYFTTNIQDRDYDLNRNFFSVRPESHYSWGDFRFTTGVVLVAENDSVAASKPGIQLFPVIKSTYQITENLRVNAAISGDVQRNTYRSFVQENPFLGPSEQLLNTVTKLSFAAGVEGLLSDKLLYRASIDLRRQSNLHFFVNSYTDTARFELVYDKQATVLQFNTAIELKVSELYALQTQLDLFHYGLTTQQAAWHRPTWMINVNHQLTPGKKIRLQANSNLMGGLKARGFEPQEIISTPKVEEVSLNPILDLQLKVFYLVSSRLSIFVEGNNLLNKKNMRWMNYPVRGIQGVGGLSFKF